LISSRSSKFLIFFFGAWLSETQSHRAFPLDLFGNVEQVFFLFEKEVNLWVRLTLTGASYGLSKVTDLSSDSILCQFFEQVSNRNLGSRPSIKELSYVQNVNSTVKTVVQQTYSNYEAI
jgi:hypothetical protein